MPDKDAQSDQSEPQAGRPDMPADYGIQDPNSGSGMLAWERTLPKIAAARNYWIGSTRPDGRPHDMPVWGLWLRDRFLFSTGRSSRKAINIGRQPYIVVHLESGDDVVILEGLAQEITDQALLAEFVEAYDKKYGFRPDTSDIHNVYYELKPQVAFAWLESDFVGGATRWRWE